MKFSIIIPAFNTEKTIGQCLEAIFSSHFKDFEVIVVSDCSTDSTVKIAKEFPCKVLQLERNSGPAYARTIGEKESKYDTLVFIDSDIIVSKETLGEIKDSFDRESDVTAVVGLLSRTHPNNDFFSVYKNLYMHFIFSRCPKYIDFIFGSIFAAKKGVLEFPHITTRFGEDTELGMKLYRKGHKILLNKDVEVIHLKKYTFSSFVQNDYRIPYHWAKLFLYRKGWENVVKNKRFSHARIGQLLSVAASFMILFSIFIHPLIAGVFILIFLCINIDFFSFFYKERGMLFMLKSIFITCLDMLVMGAGIAAGFLSYTLNKNAVS